VINIVVRNSKGRFEKGHEGFDKKGWGEK